MQEVLSEVPSASAAERMLAAAAASALAAGSAFVWFFDPTKAGFFPVCPLFALTGFACPGCGLTRGFHSLLHGDVAGALDYNAMLPFFALLVGVGFISLVVFAIKGRRSTIGLLPPNALWVFLVLLLVFGVVRNLPWYPFSVLFP